jgi:hypothetical protein
VRVLLDELATVSIEKHRLPRPVEPRLRRLVDAMTGDPAHRATMKTWRHGSAWDNAPGTVSWWRRRA